VSHGDDSATWQRVRPCMDCRLQPCAVSGWGDPARQWSADEVCRASEHALIVACSPGGSLVETSLQLSTKALCRAMKQFNVMLRASLERRWQSPIDGELEDVESGAMGMVKRLGVSGCDPVVKAIFS
jgi:hypothetical protein